VHHGEPPWFGGGEFSRLRSRLGSTTDEHAEARQLRREVTEFRPSEILENRSRYRRRVRPPLSETICYYPAPTC